MNEKEQAEIQKQLEEEPMTSEEAMARAISKLADVKKPDVLTELNEKEIRLLTRIITIGNFFDVELMKKTAWNFMRLRVSTKRKGRAEILGVAKAAKEQEDLKSKMRNLVTLGGRI